MFLSATAYNLKVGHLQIPVVKRLSLTGSSEVYVRTTHLLLKLEEAHRMVDDGRGKAIVFGAFRGDSSQFGSL